MNSTTWKSSFWLSDNFTLSALGSSTANTEQLLPTHLLLTLHYFISLHPVFPWVSFFQIGSLHSIYLLLCLSSSGVMIIPAVLLLHLILTIFISFNSYSAPWDQNQFKNALCDFFSLPDTPLGFYFLYVFNIWFLSLCCCFTVKDWKVKLTLNYRLSLYVPNCHHMMLYMLFYTIRNGILPMGFISQVVSKQAVTTTLCGLPKFLLLWINFCKKFCAHFPQHLPTSWTASVLKCLCEALLIASLYSEMWQFNPAYFWSIISYSNQLWNGLYLGNYVSLKFLYLSYGSIDTSIWSAKMG